LCVAYPNGVIFNSNARVANIDITISRRMVSAGRVTHGDIVCSIYNLGKRTLSESRIVVAGIVKRKSLITKGSVIYRSGWGRTVGDTKCSVALGCVSVKQRERSLSVCTGRARKTLSSGCARRAGVALRTRRSSCASRTRRSGCAN
jgi:hypothetical protein